MTNVRWSSILTVLAACAGKGPSPGTGADVPGAAGAHAPRPFTAEQIRDAMPVGTEIRYRIEIEGEPTTISRWVVTAADATTCTIAAVTLGEDGTLIRDEGKGTSRWTELVEHATFPAASTTITDSSVDVPAGTFATRLYEVRGADGEIGRFHFAPSLPGPPVSFTVERGGTVVRRTTLIERKLERK